MKNEKTFGGLPTEQSAALREMYAHYGHAVYACQVIEKGICSFVLTLERLGKKIQTRGEAIARDDWLQKKTRGTVLKELNKVLILDPITNQRLQEVPEIRNRLVHHYFYENGAEMTYLEGTKKLAKECEDIADELFELDTIMDSLNKQFLEKSGISAEMIQKEFERQFGISREQLMKDLKGESWK